MDKVFSMFFQFFFQFPYYTNPQLMEQLNIFFKNFKMDNLLLRELLKVVFLVIFNDINYYENNIPYLRIFIKLKRCRNNENKY